MTTEIKNLEARLTEGRIGRREFLQGATALGVSMAVAIAKIGSPNITAQSSSVPQPNGWRQWVTRPTRSAWPETTALATARA